MTPNAHDLVGPFPPGQVPEVYDQLRRRVLWSMPGGIYLLGSRAGERRNLMTTSWVTQLAREPKVLGASVECDALTNELVTTGGCFTISLIAHEERSVVRHFVKPATEDIEARTLSGMGFRDAPVSGAPIPDVAYAYLDCSLEREVDLGTHTLFIGEIVDAGFCVEESGIPAVLRMEDTRMNYGG